MPINNKAMFKISTFQIGAVPFLPDIKILASAPFSISAKRSLFRVDKYKVENAENYQEHGDWD